MTWQPIETAPQDGTYVMLANPKWQTAWQGYFRKHKEPGMGPHLSNEQVRGWTRVGFMDFQLDATHWQPLPDPPK